MENLNITRTLYKVSDFLSWQRSGSLELSPSFQRRPVWSASAKSYLIDTMARGLPIPIIFLRERTDLKTFQAKREIVDGQQRIRTVLSYIDPKCLKDYQQSRDYFQVRKLHNPELAGRGFGDLSPRIQQRILDYEFSVHILPSDVDDKQVLQIFARMNSTGVKLNAQELRNANYFGEFKQTMYDLAHEQLARWRKWEIFTEYEIARMDEVEMTSDFIFMMYKGLSARDKTSLDNFYRDHDEEFNERNVIESRFRNIMDSIDNTLGKDLNNLELRKKTLFYGLFTVIYDFHYSLGSKLNMAHKKLLPKDFTIKMKKVNNSLVNKKVPEAVLESASKRTTDLASRNTIFQYLKKELQ